MLPVCAFSLIAITLNCGFLLLERIVEVYSGTTFRTSGGTVVRAVAYDSHGGTFELICDEPSASSIAKSKLLGQTVQMWQRGFDPSGTELVSIQVHGFDYETMLQESGVGRRADEPLVVAYQDTPKLVARNATQENEGMPDMQHAPVSRYAPTSDGKLPEAYWQHAFNEVFADGATEVIVEAGRADIVNSTYAIEVDKIQKWHEAIGQALHYAKETGKQPAIALYDDGSISSAEAYAEAQKICAAEGIKVWRINDYVSPSYRLRNAERPSVTVPASWLKPSAPVNGRGLYVGPRNGVYYINSSGNKEYVTDRY